MAWRSLGDVMAEVVSKMDDEQGGDTMTATGWQTVNRKSDLAKFTEARAVDRRIDPACAKDDDRQIALFALAPATKVMTEEVVYSRLEICRYVDRLGHPLVAVLKCQGFPVSEKLTLKEIELRGEADRELLSKIELDRPPLGEMASDPESMGRISTQCGEPVGAIYANVTNGAIPRKIAEAIRDESARRKEAAGG